MPHAWPSDNVSDTAIKNMNVRDAASYLTLRRWSLTYTYGGFAAERYDRERYIAQSYDSNRFAAKYYAADIM